MRFVKMQATGNDFIVIEPPIPERDWSAEAPRLCDRHFGIGGDGVLLVLPSQTASVRMQIFLKDGSELEMCGNGIRCLTKYAVEHGLVPAGHDALTVETKAGPRTVWPRGDAAGRVESVRVDMRPPVFDLSRIPVDLALPEPVLDYPLEVDGTSLNASFLSMGNPHAVVLLTMPVEEFPLERLGPLLERHRLFPKRINAEVVNVLARDRVRVRVWERGAGLTMACGTGACAAFVVAHLKGLVADAATVEAPGGTLWIEWDGKGPVFLTGPVESVFAGEMDAEVTRHPGRQ